MVEALVKKTERLAKGKSLKNMSYPAAFGDFCNILASTSTRAYKTFKRQFGGRGIRSMRCVIAISSCMAFEFNCISRSLRAKLPRFQAGINAKNITMAADVLRKLDYRGPLALSWDDTDLEKSLSVWDEGNDIWTVLGGSDGPIQVTSAEAVDTLFDDPELKKADKVRHDILMICIS